MPTHLSIRCKRYSKVFWPLAVSPLVLSAVLYTGSSQADTWRCTANAAGDGWDCTETVKSRNPQTGQSVPHSLDWVPEAQLTDAQKTLVLPNCCGAFIAPERTDPEAKMNPAEAPMRANADRSEWKNQSLATLDGSVVVTQGYRQLKADHVISDQSQQTIALQGNIRLREPNLLITGNDALVHTDTETATVNQAEYVIHEAQVHGRAAQMERLADQVLVLKEANYTSCPPDDESWLLHSASIKLDPNTQIGTAKHMVLKIKNIPAFYLPYVTFPLSDQRKSGFLYPTIGTSDTDGLDLSVPYYLNLAPNYDATLAPRYIAGRGTMLQTELRHMSRLTYSEINLAFLGKDDSELDDNEKALIDDNLLTLEEAAPFRDEDRWALGVQQIGGIGKRWFTHIDYTRVSDVDYFQDLSTSGLNINSQTDLKRTGEAGYQFDHWRLSSTVTHYQSLRENRDAPYRLEPQLAAFGAYQWGNWNLSLNNQWTSFTHANEQTKQGGEIITGERSRIDYRLTWNKQWIWGFFRPSAYVKSVSYALDDDNLLVDADSEPSFTVPQGSLDMGLFFERDSLWGKSNYIQTFEPRVFYFYSDYEDQSALIDITEDGQDVDFDTSETTFTYSQLFRTSRFSGGDRIDDANQVAMGLTTRWIERNTGVERLSLSIGQIYYTRDRRISLTGEVDDLPNSEIAGQIGAQVGENLRFTSDLLYNDDEGKLSRGTMTLSYLDDSSRLLNLGYYYTRKNSTIDTSGNIIDKDIEQSDISLVWPIAGNWNLIARSNHDMTNQRELETLLGIEYNSCCYRVRLLGRRWLDNNYADVVADEDLKHDRGIFFEIEFRGLGGTSKTIDNILSDSINGYDRREMQRTAR